MGILLSLLLSLSLINFAFAQTTSTTELTFVWHKGVLADNLVKLSEEYTKATGIKVRGELFDADRWHDAIADDFKKKAGRFDLVIFDSQSMSEFASQGHLILLNRYMKKTKSIRAANYDQAALSQYAEYPDGSNNLYALPLNQDVMGLAYRKDLFEDPKEKDNFQAKYGYELKVPETYDQLIQIAEFFTRPDQNFYGIGIYGSERYDAATSSFNSILWSFGGELWDPSTRKVEGVINSAVSIAALEYFVRLFQFAPPEAKNWFWEDVNRLVVSGKVAMAINWYYFFGAYANPRTNPYADRMAFSSLPAGKGPDGQSRQFYCVGGQGISVSKYSRNADAAWKFLEWLMSREVQWKWVQSGGQTGRIDILKSPEYAKATPFNASFPASMSRVKDYWHLVEYPQMLGIYQKYVNMAIKGNISAKEALDKTAAEQQALLK